MLRPTASSFRSEICDSNRCWKRGTYTDGGVTASLGDHWHLFLIEKHMQGGRCVSPREGGYCDVVAVQDQPTSSQVKLIELKTSGRVAQARPQLRKAAEFLQGRSLDHRCQVVAEVHRRGARGSVRRFSPLNVGDQKIPVRVIHIS